MIICFSIEKHIGSAIVVVSLVGFVLLFLYGSFLDIENECGSCSICTVNTIKEIDKFIDETCWITSSDNKIFYMEREDLCNDATIGSILINKTSCEKTMFGKWVCEEIEMNLIRNETSPA